MLCGSLRSAIGSTLGHPKICEANDSVYEQVHMQIDDGNRSRTCTSLTLHTLLPPSKLYALVTLVNRNILCIHRVPVLKFKSFMTSLKQSSAMYLISGML